MQGHRMIWPWCALTSVNGFLWVIRSLITEQDSHLSKSRFLSQTIYIHIFVSCVFWLTQHFVEWGNLHEFDTLYGGERVKNTCAVRLGDLVVTHGDVTDHLIVAWIGLRSNRQLSYYSFCFNYTFSLFLIIRSSWKIIGPPRILIRERPIKTLEFLSLPSGNRNQFTLSCVKWIMYYYLWRPYNNT